MEITIFQVITAIVGVLVIIGSVVGLIAWFIRLESKNTSNEKQTERLEKELAEFWKEFETHRLNGNIHFDERITKQVDLANERRFQTIEKQLTEINSKLDRLAAEKK